MGLASNGKTFSGSAVLANKQQVGYVAHLSGQAAEQSVERLYQRAGFEIVERRWRGRGGEIDLIVQMGAGFVFVEVKKARNFDQAAERLSARQMQRLQDAAEEFLSFQPCGQLSEVRFDVALVNGAGELRVVENAFGHF